MLLTSIGQNFLSFCCPSIHASDRSRFGRFLSRWLGDIPDSKACIHKFTSGPWFVSTCPRFMNEAYIERINPRLSIISDTSHCLDDYVCFQISCSRSLHCQATKTCIYFWRTNEKREWKAETGEKEWPTTTDDHAHHPQAMNSFVVRTEQFSRNRGKSFRNKVKELKLRLQTAYSGASSWHGTEFETVLTIEQSVGSAVPAPDA